MHQTRPWFVTTLVDTWHLAPGTWHPVNLGRRRPAQEHDHLPFTSGAKRALEQSLRQALALKDEEIRAEHVLLGLLASDDDLAAVLLRRLGVALPVVRDRLSAAPAVRRAS